MAVGTVPGGSVVDFSNTTDDKVINLANTDATTNPAFYNVNVAKGGQGTDVLMGSNEYENTLQAGTGSNALMGGTKNDVLVGNSESGKSESAFVFGAGQGVDTIQSFDFGVSDSNDLVDLDLLAGLSGNDLQLTGAKFDASGNLTVGLSDKDSLVVEGAENQAIKAQAFGQEWKLKYGSSLTYEEGVEIYAQLGGEDDATLSVATDTAVYMNNWTGEDDAPAYMGVKELTAVGYSGNVSLAGANNTDNVITGGSGDNKLWGGFGGDDTVNAGAGTSELFYLKGDGNDTFNGLKSGDAVNLLNVDLSDINLGESSVTGSQIVAKMNDGSTLTVNGDINSVDFKVNGNTFRRQSDGTWNLKS